jgi:hypothetical protein
MANVLLNDTMFLYFAGSLLIGRIGKFKPPPIRNSPDHLPHVILIYHNQDLFDIYSALIFAKNKIEMAVKSFGECLIKQRIFAVNLFKIK